MTLSGMLPKLLLRVVSAMEMKLYIFSYIKLCHRKAKHFYEKRSVDLNVYRIKLFCLIQDVINLLSNFGRNNENFLPQFPL